MRTHEQPGAADQDDPLDQAIPPTETQPGDEPLAHADEDTHNPDLDAREEALRDRLTGAQDLDDADDQAAPPADALDGQDPPAQPGGEPPADDAGADDAPPPDAEQPRANAPEVGDPSDEEMGRWHKSAKRHVSRLLKERGRLREQVQTIEQQHAQASKSLDVLGQICAETGLAPQAVPALLRTVGHAFGKRDPQALAQLGEHLHRVGYQAPAAVDVARLQAALRGAEDSLDFAELRAVLAPVLGQAVQPQPASPPAPVPQTPMTAPQAPPALPPQAPPVSAPAPGVREAVLTAVHAMDEEIGVAVGGDRAAHERVAAAVLARVRSVAATADPSAIPALMRVALDAELARVSQHKQPSQPVRPASAGAAQPTPFDRREAELKRRMGVG